ncbi:hypothetical protein NUSPORA_02024 [Nucleospora cyclopteri]
MNSSSTLDWDVECVYCYNSIKTGGISVFSCFESVCDEHLKLHHGKCGCEILFIISIKKQDELSCIKNKVNNGFNKEIGGNYEFVYKKKLINDFKELELLNEINKNCEISILKNIFNRNEILQNIKSKLNLPADFTNCPHINENKREINEVEHCSNCEIDRGLWKCLYCNFVGCGREQPGSIGKNHMLKHSKSSSHSQAVLITNFSLVYCYLCDSFIENIPEISKEENFLGIYKKTDCENFALLCDIHENDLIYRETNLTGIKNEGSTCYISCGLHLISYIMKSELDKHFNLCNLNGRYCFMCQLAKVIGQLTRNREINNGQSNLNIKLFLQVLYEYFPQFCPSIQGDSSEFIQTALDKIVSFNKDIEFLEISNLFEFSYENKNSCENCQFTCSFIENWLVVPLQIQSSVQESINNLLKNETECSNCKKQASSIVKPKKFPKYLILSFNRGKFENNQFIKDCRHIKCNEVLKVEAATYELEYCIIHHGQSLDFGHYVFYDKKRDLVISDEIIRKLRKNELEESVLCCYKYNK